MPIWCSLCYMATEDKTHVTVKAWKQSLAKLRMIYALTGKAMIQILDELLTAELERLQAEG